MFCIDSYVGMDLYIYAMSMPVFQVDSSRKDNLFVISEGKTV